MVYMEIKKLSALLRGTISKNNSVFFAWFVIQWFKTKSIFESHKKYVKVNVFFMS